MRVLQIIESAYRANLEEQDDPIVWLTACLQNAGADQSVLLTGNAVNYILAGQDSRGLSFGRWKQTRPPCLADELSGLIAKRVRVYAVREDLERRGLLELPRIGGVSVIARKDVPQLADEHQRVWHW